MIIVVSRCRSDVDQDAGNDPEALVLAFDKGPTVIVKLP